jgi:hypothetical protein
MARTRASQPEPDPERETVSINVPLPGALHRQLRIRAISDDMSVKDAVIAAITEYVA